MPYMNSQFESKCAAKQCLKPSMDKNDFIEEAKREIHREIFYYLSLIAFLAGWSGGSISLYILLSSPIQRINGISIPNPQADVMLITFMILGFLGVMGMIMNSKS